MDFAMSDSCSVRKNASNCGAQIGEISSALLSEFAQASSPSRPRPIAEGAVETDKQSRADERYDRQTLEAGPFDRGFHLVRFASGSVD
jgi:hypothetical protein